MAILPQALLSLVGRDLLALAFLARSHPSSLSDRLCRGDRFRSLDRTGDRGSQFLARLEDRDQLGGNHDFGSAARVARPAGATLTNFERPESADLEMLALTQGAADRVDEAIDNDRRVVLRHSCGPRDLFHEVGLGHDPSVYIPLMRDECGRRSRTNRRGPELARPRSPYRRQMWI